MNLREWKKECVRMHKQLCKELGITPVPVLFEKDQTFTAYYRWGSHIAIDVKDCIDNDFNPLFLMAHETRHHYQWSKGWIGQSAPDVKRDWKKKSCSVAYYKGILDRVKLTGDFQEEYNKLPWEADANKFARFIMRREGLEQEL